MGAKVVGIGIGNIAKRDCRVIGIQINIVAEMDVRRCRIDGDGAGTVSAAAEGDPVGIRVHRQRDPGNAGVLADRTNDDLARTGDIECRGICGRRIDRSSAKVDRTAGGRRNRTGRVSQLDSVGIDVDTAGNRDATAQGQVVGVHIQTAQRRTCTNGTVEVDRAARSIGLEAVVAREGVVDASVEKNVAILGRHQTGAIDGDVPGDIDVPRVGRHIARKRHSPAGHVHGGAGDRSVDVDGVVVSGQVDIVIRLDGAADNDIAFRSHGDGTAGIDAAGALHRGHTADTGESDIARGVEVARKVNVDGSVDSQRLDRGIPKLDICTDRGQRQQVRTDQVAEAD